MKKGLSTLFLIFCTVALLVPTAGRCDEGLWLFTNPPRKELKERYNFELTDEFLQLLQFSSLRFGNGGSGSFVSPNGLVMTNHHVAVSSLQKLSTPENDLVKNGFYAATIEEELPVPELEILLLASIEDVTQRVNAAVNDQMNYTEAKEARQAAINTIEQESFKSTGFKSDVITLYQGGQYHLYRYKKFDDIRLVFAPEESVGFFGGNPDNFEYPRYNLDVSFFRIYENGKPFTPPQYLRMSGQNVAENELVFVSGHPARTNRFDTMTHLLFRQETSIPYMLDRSRRREITLQSYAEKSKEHARRVASDLFRIQNTRKNLTGVLLGLQTPALMEKQAVAQTELYNKVREQKLIDLEKFDPWNVIGEAILQLENKRFYYLYELIEKGDAFNSDLYKIARGIVEYVEETQKPNEKRQRAWQDSALPAMKDQILSPLPIYPDLDAVKLTDSLGMYLEYIADSTTDWELGTSEQDDGFNLLAGKSPKERAYELVYQTKLADVEVRRQLLEGGVEAIKNSTDPMIQFAAEIYAISSDIRDMYESEVAEPMKRAYAQITLLRIGQKQDTSYPDATFTLRLSFGKVAGYTENDGTAIPAMTTLGGTFEHAKQHEFIPPYDLPETWRKAEATLDLQTPINLVTTNDIIGGNSGSPLVNSKGQIVGLIFDGNVQSLVSNFIYTEDQGRAVSVHALGILVSLHQIYNATRIVQEILEASQK